MLKIIKLNKNYESSDLKDLKSKGVIIKRDYTNDTFGTSSMGYLERKGLTLNDIPYQVIYTSKGYGKITSKIISYNGKGINVQKYNIYKKEVNEHFKNNVLDLLKGGK